MAMNPMAGMGRPPTAGGMPPSMGVAPMGQAPSPQMGGGIAPSTGNVMQITATLRGMPDAQLQQYAAMHKSDPFVFPLAFQESKTRQQMRAGQAAQMAGQKPLPVVDQDLAQMTPPAPMGLPEDQGIGALNAPNLQNMADGGIAGYADGGPQQPGMFNYAQMAPAVDLHPNSGVTPRSMASGGIAHFANGGLDDYAPQILTEAKRLGIDPRVALNLFKTESAGNPNAISNKGATGLGQLMEPAAKEMGISKEDRFDPQKNISASLGYFKKQLNRFGDYEKAAAAYNWGPGNLKKHLEKNEGVLDRLSLPKETANYLTKLVPSAKANAETVPGREPTVPVVPTNPMDQIPGQNVKAPASNYEQTNTYFGGLADRLGISPEVQRNISNSLNALGGYSSPISSVGRGVGTASRALEPTAEMVAKAEQAKNAVALPRIAGPSKVFEGLTPEAQAMRDSAVQARQLRALEADKQVALGAEQSVNAAAQTSDIARKMEESIANARRVGATAKIPGTEKAITLGGRLNEAKMSGAAQGLAAMNDMEKMGLASTATEPQYPNENGPEDRWNMPAPTPNPATDKTEAGKQTAEPKQGSDFNDRLLHLGLGLMAGQSPHALQNLGNAGLGTLKHEQDMKRAALEERKQTALEALQKQQGNYLGAQAGYYEDLRGPQAALASADRNFTEWQKNPLHLNATPEQARTAYQTFIQDAFKNLGIIHPSRISEQAKADVFKYNPQ
jgi:hypothetical protein